MADQNIRNVSRAYNGLSRSFGPQKPPSRRYSRDGSELSKSIIDLRIDIDNSFIAIEQEMDAKPFFNEVASAAQASTTETSFQAGVTVLDDMTLTEGATLPVGFYFLVFSASGKVTGNNRHITVTVFKSGVQQSTFNRFIADVGADDVSIVTSGRVEVEVSDVIEVHWIVAAGSGTMESRTMSMIEVN